MDAPLPALAMHRLAEAIDSHDADQVAACFAEQYLNETPAHPARGFTGREQVRRNWTAILGAVPDLSARMVSMTVDGNRAWCEWDWEGIRADGTPHLMRGVTITDVEDGLITRARFYMEPVVDDGRRIDDAVRSNLGAEPAQAQLAPQAAAR